MRFPLVSGIERKVVFAGCYLVIGAGLTFFAKLVFFQGISTEFIQSLFFLGAGLIALMVLIRYEEEDDLEEELARRDLRAECAGHPEQFGIHGEHSPQFSGPPQIHRDDPILRDQRFVRTDTRNFPDPQQIEDDGRPDSFVRYAPVESGPLAPLSLAHTGSRLLSRGGVQADGPDDFGAFADDTDGVGNPGFEEFSAHLPLKGAEREPASAAK